MIVGSIQRAIDDKLYITANGTVQALSVINNPNASGAAMSFSPYALSIAPKQPRLGLPNFINNYTRNPPSMFTHSIACQTTSFFSPGAPTFSNGCSSTPYPYNGYLWDFGDANTSTQANPVHTYSATGTYTVKLVLFSPCTNDTLEKTITLTTPGPTLYFSGMETICKGDERTYTVTGNNTTWYNGSTSPTISLNPTVTSVYSASASLNGCTLSKTYTVTVNSCNAIDDQVLSHPNLNIWPNPARESIFFSLHKGEGLSNVTIVNHLGLVVKQKKVSLTETAEIEINDLPEGMYVLSLNKDGMNTYHKRFMVIKK